MIFTALFYMAGWIIGLIGGILASLIPIQFPTGFQSSISYFVSYLGYAAGFINLSVLRDCTITFVIFYLAIYAVKVVLFGYSAVPFFGKKVDLPSMHARKIENS